MNGAKKLQKLAQTYQDGNEDTLLFIPLGGVGEIGMNAYLYHYKQTWLLVDIGIGFADYRTPGIDTLLPDLEILGDLPLDAVLLTHSHEDHIGGIAELIKRNPVPIYVGEYTEILVKQKLTGFDNVEYHQIKPDESFMIGDIEIIPRSVNHSVPEAFAFYFDIDLGLIIHSGDWKYDDAPIVGTSFTAGDWDYKGKKIKAMMCDSTNVMVTGNAGSESLIAPSLQTIIADSKDYRLFVTCFASNVARLKSIMLAGHQAGRKILLMGRAMKRIYEAGQQMGWLNDEIDIIDEENISDVNPEKLLILVTGSQGEGRAMLAKIARGEQKKIKITENDRVIFSSRTIPGNEIDIAQVQNRIAEQGGDIIYADDEQAIHVSGHYQKDEIEATYKILQPEWVVPMHGEARHLRFHCNVAKQAGLGAVYIPQNGAVVKITDDNAEICGIIKCETHMVEPSGLILHEDAEELLERKKITYNGALHMALAVGKRNNALKGHPYITPIGLTIFDDQLDDIEDQVADLYKEYHKEGLELDDITEKLKSLLRKQSRILLKKRPVITIAVLKI
ncbi:MAG: ribonuclease J [Alphaproteobacteria bacterium]|nr:ribonuclease J [Alphaproteobacteria bacterium]